VSADEIPRPRARHIATQAPQASWRCDAGTCPLLVAVMTSRWYRYEGGVRVAEHFVCLGHGLEFAQRYRIQIGDAQTGDGR